MLELATTALAIISAWRYPSVDGGLDYLNYRSAGKVLFDLDYFGIQDVARRGERHKNHQPLMPCDAFAAKGQAVYLDSNNAAN